MANGDAAAAQEASLRPITLEEELRKDPQLKEQDVALLRDWVSMQPHLPPVHDRELALFLHKCDYSVEASKAMVDYYFTVRTLFSEIFLECVPTACESRKDDFKKGILKLPGKTPEGYSVFLERLVSDPTDRCDIVELTKRLNLAIDFHLLEDGITPGVVHVVDLKGINLGHLTQVDLLAFKKYRPLQDSYPYRRIGIHFVNAVPFMDTIMKVIKPFIKDELFNMIHIHADGLQSLFKFVPQDILPEDYGGSAPSFIKLNERMQNLLLANREIFLADRQRVVDEQKRPERPQGAKDLFGLEGTFRTLDID